MSLSFFEKRFVVNLPSRTDRRSQMQRELERIGLTAEFFNAFRFEKMEPFHRVGSRGAYMSHLAILEKSIGARNVLMLQDDVNFITDKNRFSIISELPSDWAIFYGGFCEANTKGSQTLIELDPNHFVTGLHFVGVNGPHISMLVAALKQFLERPRDHPLGGPMPIDGAFNIFRQQHPHLRTYAAIPPLGYQRSSRSDCSAHRWFDKGITAPIITTLRSLKNSIRP